MNRGTILLLAIVASLLVAPTARADDVLAEGTFKGASGHQTSGTASLVHTDGGAKLVLGADFSLDGAPDPKVGFGKGGAYDRASQLAHLKSETGEQSYDVPATLDLSAYDEVYIWCERFSVPLGVARLR